MASDNGGIYIKPYPIARILNHEKLNTNYVE
jgi:hypothetical protein